MIDLKNLPGKALTTSQFHDPLSINLVKHVRVLVSKLPTGSPISAALTDATQAPSYDILLGTLSDALALPALTLSIASTFRPILFDLCARWLLTDDNTDDQLVALCLLIEIHTEVFPILSAFLRKPRFANGPLSFLLSCTDLKSVESARLHRLLLAYYRIQQANRELPGFLHWPLSPLSKLLWAPHPDKGVCLMAVRCYALQSGMGEAEKEELQRKIMGEKFQVDCDMEFGTEFDGSSRMVDGWIMPIIEVERITKARNEMVREAQDFYGAEEGDDVRPIHPSELSPLTANVHGVFMLRSHGVLSETSGLVMTPSIIQTLRVVAMNFSLRIPVLLTSVPSSAKVLLLSHLANQLFPGAKNQIVTIHLADTSLDPRSLLGSYVSSTRNPGTFEWKEGVIVRAMREGKWVIFKDIDRASNEVLGLIKPLVESLGLDQWIGARASLQVPSRGLIRAEEKFALFATRSVHPSKSGEFATPAFFGAHKFHEVVVHSPTSEELETILLSVFPILPRPPVLALINLWEAVKSLGSPTSTHDIGLRELEKFTSRISSILPSSYHPIDVDVDDKKSLTLSTMFPSPTLREEMYLEARDVFFGGGALASAARAYLDSVSVIVAEHLGLEPARRQWVLNERTPEFDIETDPNGQTIALRIGRKRLLAKKSDLHTALTSQRPFAMHKPAIRLLSRLASAVLLNEAVLLIGETGTGKTSLVSHLASILRRRLISLNLSHQTESSDLIGGFKPVDARVLGSELQERFIELFGRTFSRRKNVRFEESIKRAVGEQKWKRAVALWMESVRLAKERIQGWHTTEAQYAFSLSNEYASGREGNYRNKAYEDQKESPKKKRKANQSTLDLSQSMWAEFEHDVTEFEAQHVQAKGKFAFAFAEGPLVKAIRTGAWVLLDEVNLAVPDTLDCISSLLDGPTASLTLTEDGALEPVPRHPEFRLFACMNPANDVGKKDLPPSIRARFTEIDVPPPDADKETLLSIITKYIGASAVGDKGAILDVAEFYCSLKELANNCQIADGSNHRPHYNMRTLSRALTFAADLASTYGLRRALWEGCLMAFTMILNASSTKVVTDLAQKHLLCGVRNLRSFLSKAPGIPNSRTEDYVKFGPFYLLRGPLPKDPVDDYIRTPSVEAKLIDLARILVTRRFPILIEGPTSSGKTSSVEFLARQTGHRFVRINNHEHTDIQEYLGSYVSEPRTGKLVYKDGLLVRALRRGDWLVLDELNLAPTEVLEALNRLLDDNRELVIPETQEVVRPHSNFMLFATQNPPGLYAGRKVLSRAFRSRFLEVHFDEVPQDELETILCQRCRIAPSYAQRIVMVFFELQRRRQSGRVFESKHGFATLRDLFRWAGRDAVGYQELAENGYMLLAERARRVDDKAVVKEVIESIMKVRIDEATLYSIHRPNVDLVDFLGCPFPTSSRLVWTTAMQRLFILLSRALRFNEPVLLVGETGTGKTTVCEVYAQVVSKHLHCFNCHQNSETADLIGGLRPVRSRTGSRPPGSIFEWRDGPLITAMRAGEVFLMDEISLADDSVLERLNSVLEPSRTIVLAERGGDDVENQEIRANTSFKFIATMNPGGDYGKKELSPALRNRFTEIWVPHVNDPRDLELIVRSLWEHQCFEPYTSKLLDFVHWICNRAGDTSVSSLRDILAWVQFSNKIHCLDAGIMPLEEVFHHAASMMFLDGLHSIPQLSTYSREALRRLRSDALSKLQEIAPLPNGMLSFVPYHDLSTSIQWGAFAIPKGPLEPLMQSINWDVPTTRENITRLVRACQLHKPILLEGSPGVGKTSLVTALASVAGYPLCRINLSDQTDLVDLFGSDLPVEGGGAGEFAWRDAEFLKAMQDGHWVLLDEMNLAPQAVLEGLNAVLDHRGTVYIPELSRTFTCHPGFRVFAAQNPLHQGGGRKGLPKSFVNRFTKVYVEELSSSDLFSVCQDLFSSCNNDFLRGMVAYNTLLTEEVSVKRTLGREGAPWEFNLRDVIRWGTLLSGSPYPVHPHEFVDTVYVNRFRNATDRYTLRQLFETTFPDGNYDAPLTPRLTISPTHLQIRHFYVQRENYIPSTRTPQFLQSHLSFLESIGLCVSQSWLVIITGAPGCGKTSLIRSLAHFTGNVLHEISVNGATDAMDILGSFEQVDDFSRSLTVVKDVIALVDRQLRTVRGSQYGSSTNYHNLRKMCADPSTSSSRLLKFASELLDEINDWDEIELAEQVQCRRRIQDLITQIPSVGRFEWVDGPLVTAIKNGSWVLLDGANLCNPSVLDRLNSLCEAGGILTLSERGFVNGKAQVLTPSPGFRLFMTVDPQFGELSRAMRNRGIEISLTSGYTTNDYCRLRNHLRLPVITETDVTYSPLMFEATRRGLQSHKAITAAEPLSTVPRFLQESSLSSLMLYSPLLSQALETTPDTSALHVLSRVVPPTEWSLARRFITTHPGVRPRQVANLFRLLEDDRPLEGTIQVHLRSRGLPPSLVSSQPTDFYLSCAPCPECRMDLSISSPHLRVLHILQFILAVLVDQESAFVFATHKSCSSPESSTSEVWGDGVRMVDAICTLLESISAAANTLRRRVGSGELHQHSLDVEVLLPLLQYAHHLRQAASSATLDYSMVHVFSTKISEILNHCPSHMLQLKHCSQVLENTASLTSGLGLFEIWKGLLPCTGLTIQGKDLWLPCNNSLSQQPSTSIEDALSIFAELSALSRSYAFPISWLVVQRQIQWLSAVWTLDSPESTLSGPSMLLRPTQLWLTAQKYDTNRHPLSDLNSYQNSILRHAKMLFQPFENRTRSEQLEGFLLYLILMALSCFSFPFQDSRKQDLTSLDSNPRLDLPALADKVTLLLDKLQDDAIGQCLRRHLHPILSRLTKEASDKPLGRWYLTLSKLISELYIPNIPIDPAVIQVIALKLSRDAQNTLHSQATLHMNIEQADTGDRRNTVVDYLTGALQNVEKELNQLSKSAFPQRPDTSALHVYWREVSRFGNEVLSSSKIDPLLLGLDSNESASTLREQVVQESISGFCQRLSRNYSDYRDINIALQIALLSARLGLRLMAEMSTVKDDVSYFLAASAVAFPSVRSAMMLLLETPATSSCIPPISHILLKLASIGFESFVGIDIEFRWKQLATLYDQALRLWRIDRAKEAGSVEASQSLYRYKNTSSNSASDAEMEQQEFLELFPDFEDALDQSFRDHTYNGDIPSYHVNSDQMQQLVSIYLLIEDPKENSLAMRLQVSAIFKGTRRMALRSVLSSQMASLPERLDLDSRVFQLLMLHNRLTEAQMTTTSAKCNFYTDANVSQAKKAVFAIEALRVRLQALIHDWPDQMVLHQLKDRCDLILQLDLHSPVAKLLSVLEQLLLKIEDWEMYASRDNTLKMHKDVLASLIVEWRRLELSCWNQLLQFQAKSFADSASEWWFRLYDAIVCGALDASVQGHGATSDPITLYLDNLIPLLDDFICTSPLGQFHTRLALLRGFENHVHKQSLSQENASKVALQRVFSVLHATIQYYDLFSISLTNHLSRERGALEKEIHAFIKLASWKDINVLALKQSAQRTHHHLFKIVRKFREVLRQPITHWLQAGLAGDLERVTEVTDLHTISEQTASPSLSFPASSLEHTLPRHLVDLKHTYQKFTGLISGYIQRCLAQRSASNVDGLAVQILVTATALSKEAPPGSAANREKHQKSLLVRKRKAWSDLLKELKRGGLSANVRPDILRQQYIVRWIREQPILPLSACMKAAIEKVENYYNRFNNSMVLLRALLPSHHPDVSTRDLQRGVMYLESSFNIALDTRSCLAVNLRTFEELNQIVHRLNKLSCSPSLKVFTSDPFPKVSAIGNSLSRLQNALIETIDALHALEQLQCSPNIQEVHDQIQNAILHVNAQGENIRALLDSINVERTFTVLSIDECSVAEEALKYMSTVLASLDQLVQNQPVLSPILGPVRSWLEKEILPLALSEPPSSNDAVDADSAIINVLLYSVQSLLEKFPLQRNVDSSKEADHYIRDDARLTCDIANLLNLPALKHHLSSVLIGLLLCSSNVIQNSINRFLPFLKQYLHFAQEQLITHTHWVKALFKLNLVLSSVMNNLSKDGFCKPPESADDGSGDGGDVSELVDGTGLGEGTGKANITEEIEDESQVEGIQDEEQGENDHKDGDDNTIETSEDPGGDLDNVSEAGSQDRSESGEQSQDNLDEHIGNLDPSDPSVLDEKLWGDDAGLDNHNDRIDKTDKDHSTTKDAMSEVVAREGSQPARDQDLNDNADGDDADEQSLPDDIPEKDDHQPEGSGAPIDDYAQDANTLDLPDDLNLGTEDEMQEDCEEGLEETNSADHDNLNEETESLHNSDSGERTENTQEQNIQEMEDIAEDQADNAIAQPDISSSDGSGENQAVEPSAMHSATKGHQLGDSTAAGEEQERVEEHQTSSEVPRPLTDDDLGVDGTGAADTTSQQGLGLSKTDEKPSDSPFRRPGDSSQEIHDRVEEILDAQSKIEEKNVGTPTQVQHLGPDDSDHDMQVLGPAEEEQTANLNELKFATVREAPQPEYTPMDVDTSFELTLTEARFHPDSQGAHKAMEDIDGTVTDAEVRGRMGSINPNPNSDPLNTMGDVEMEDTENEDAEVELRKWQGEDYPEESTENLWRLYESLTHDLAHVLCEQLRLILEPTRATRLKGDYRTGKRLNMKKIIPFIASDYTKDKIWLRRTRPSQREYQVLIALDDSRSMSESHSIHLAYETLALVARALNRLEVGDIAIVKFGEAMDVLHGFDDGPFTDQAGVKIMNAFRFNQKATNVFSLVSSSLKVLEAARDRRSLSSAAAGELWQLEIIISDGVCQDHDRLRPLLRKAQEQRVMIVFIIIDSLHSRSEAATSSTPIQNSILSMNQVTYSEVDGKLEMQVNRYLDSFPFEFFVVVRSVEALPEVLSNTLKQFFERIAEK